MLSNQVMKMARVLLFTLALVTAAQPASAGLGSFCARLLGRQESETRIALEKKDEVVWKTIIPSLKVELETFSQLNAEQKEKYLKEQSDAFDRKYVNNEFGAHYNLHGGLREDYLDKNGISFSMGDSGIDQGFSRDRRQKIYFFNLKSTDLYTVLNSRNPNQILIRQRMGNVLTLFDVQAVRKFLNETYPGAIEENTISFSLDGSQSVRTRAVPSKFYVTVPLEVFSGYKSRLGRRLSWDEETLVTMRLIDAYLQSH